MPFIILFFLSLFSLASFAIEIAPETLVESSPLESFSQKAEGWPSETVSNQAFQSKSTSIYESLKKYPGIQTQGELSSGTPSIRIRGSGGAARTLVLLDGSPINTQDGTGANPLLLPSELIGQIEILKGPASLFYGSDAVGGALNLIPQVLKTPLVTFGYETPNNPSLFLGSPLLQKKEHFLQATIFTEHIGGDYKYKNPTGLKEKRDFNTRNKQRYSLLGKDQFLKTELSYQLIYARLFGQSPGPIPINTLYITDFNNKAYFGFFKISQKIHSNLGLNFTLSHSGASNRYITGGASSDFKASRSMASLNLDYLWSTDASANLFFDFFEDRLKYDILNNGPLKEHHNEPGFIIKSQLSDEDFVLAGLRYFSKESALIKNILLKKEKSFYSLWASYSEGIRVPDFTQKYAQGFGFTGNPDLKPEESWQIEVGAEKPMAKIKTSFLDYLSLRLTGFTTDYENFIEYVFPASPYSYKNIDGVLSKGVEFSSSFDYRIFHGTLSYSLIYSRNKETKEETFLLPKHQGFLLLGAQLSAFIFEVQNTYWGRYALNQTEKASSWFTTDFLIRTSSLQNWTFKIGILNLFNKELTFTKGYPEPGRQYFSEIEYLF